ncbi:DNA-directed RNA polymerase I kDa polypeptide [Suillus subaureus]|jgi:DNA-directed RNA polymerase I subunit RPA12|uniref:DNA-directed RNA polymerase subunit n=1 Tax=Suillus subaureus TaxID=48587 RepID=A0A9P7E8P2_9AGAM|nr:DNA-directed RNA polymerase I kDa polypeptide [Suillus subaureus]XP_041303527.1 transcription factor S-II-domain-containing protein [Suillus bovinus]KAG1814405.1 DNA-directed RNA polymerase I kDa polypeptide [Suillus subaureus]KAG2134579.1 transcription factor S-II-domain-containing protein [Suillus bovinus]
MPTLAHKIGSLIFCPHCGTLLSPPKDDEKTVICEQCSYEEPASSYENIEITTRSHPEAFPSALRQKRKTQTKVHQGKVLPKVSEKCPACGHLEAYYEEKQMRSADEGSTILYTCVSCKHGWRVNN